MSHIYYQVSYIFILSFIYIYCIFIILNMAHNQITFTPKTKWSLGNTPVQRNQDILHHRNTVHQNSMKNSQESPQWMLNTFAYYKKPQAKTFRLGIHYSQFAATIQKQRAMELQKYKVVQYEPISIFTKHKSNSFNSRKIRSSGFKSTDGKQVAKDNGNRLTARTLNNKGRESSVNENEQDNSKNMDRKILLTFNTKFPLYKGRVTTLKIGHDRVLDSKI